MNRLHAAAPVALRRVEVVVNAASGGVEADADAEAGRILADLGVEGRVQAPAPGEIADALRRAVDAGPDALFVIAGDGTARAAAELCGPTGPVLAPLPGGTMNMLPRALYGDRAWPEALAAALRSGEARMVGGGEVDGRRFLVAAILGAPALWAPAREAIREGRPKLAYLRARRALQRAFTGRLRFSLDTGARGRAEALAFMCPLTSRALDDAEAALEVASLDPGGAAEAFRLGMQAMVGDWRDDASVETGRCRRARVWASGSIPAILDGESVRLPRTADVRYRAEVVRMLTLPQEAT